MQNYTWRDYRLVLRDTLLKRQSRNPAYSLRSFARDLGMTAANLSQIFSGKNGISVKRAQEISEKLSLNPFEAEIFCDLVSSRHARDAGTRETAKKRLENVEASSACLDLDAFKIIEDWYHFAILETLKIKIGRLGTGRIAAYLRIDPQLVRHALERLRRLKLVNRLNGRWEATHHRLTTTHDIPSRSIRSFHHQVLGKAAEALETQPVQDREFGSTMLAIKHSDITKAKEAIREFRKKFCAEFAVEADGDDVYCLATQFFSPATEATPHQNGVSWEPICPRRASVKAARF